MRVSIHDRAALLAVPPSALSAYARTSGWTRHENYRTHSDTYIGKDLPEIIVPRTEDLGDYASVVARLIDVFAEVAQKDALTVYRSLVTTNFDVIRLRSGQGPDGSVRLADGVDLISGAHDLLLATACSLDQPGPVHRPGANQSAKDLLEKVRLGQTDHGSFVVTILAPVAPPSMPGLFQGIDPDPPDERRLTVHLMKALAAARLATDRCAKGVEDAFGEEVENGVSANLCGALSKMIGAFPTLDVSVSWASTRPVAVEHRTVQFVQTDAPLLTDGAASLRRHAARVDVRLLGHVKHLRREATEKHGTIRLNTVVDPGQQPRSVSALLERKDYEQAVQAHKERAQVVVSGDLERLGQRWWLLNPRLEKVMQDDEC